MRLAIFLSLVATASAAFTTPEQGSELYGWIFATSPTDQNDAGQHFQDEIFQKEPLHVSRSFNRSYYEVTLPLQQLWPTLPETATKVQSLAVKGNPIDIRVDGQKVSTSDSLNKVLASNVLDHEAIPAKTSFIIKFEELADHGMAIEQLQQRFAKDSTRASSIHGYYSAAGGSKALHAHTDPYDVVILQIVGSKHWTMCVPPLNSTTQMSTAESAILYAKDHADGNSCVSYNADTLTSLTCTNFVMKAGDALYLPRDVIHFAETGDSASIHLTIGLGGDHNENCDEDNLNSFERDVVQQQQQQRSRRSCTSGCSSYGTSYCDLSCDTSCDSCSALTSYSYNCYSYYYSCDSSCDDSCDFGCGSSNSYTYCPTGTPTYTPSYYDDDYYYDYDDDYHMSSGATVGIVIGALICGCLIFGIPIVIICSAHRQQQQQQQQQRPQVAAVAIPDYNNGGVNSNNAAVAPAYQPPNNNTNTTTPSDFNAYNQPPPSYNLATTAYPPEGYPPQPGQQQQQQQQQQQKQQEAYPPNATAQHYPPTNSTFPPTNSTYPPSNPGYPPNDSGYPSYPPTSESHI